MNSVVSEGNPLQCRVRHQRLVRSAKLRTNSCIRWSLGTILYAVQNSAKARAISSLTLCSAEYIVYFPCGVDESISCSAFKCLLIFRRRSRSTVCTLVSSHFDRSTSVSLLISSRLRITAVWNSSSMGAKRTFRPSRNLM